MLIYNVDEAIVCNDDVDSGVYAVDGVDLDELAGMFHTDCVSTECHCLQPKTEMVIQ